ncbi:xylose isomerase [Coraliomargarita sinensis]|uniref:Xylose isomerase n=1 Tax=Coraliomargarita sinensis TaxID=2174842 RepID=A0A317ZDH5_9BACT|nr:TIM barrel protein [Coraliomargarita sinensis]PXA03364.1 xylose isomerase [Coraliomargarita sinensis]
MSLKLHNAMWPGVVGKGEPDTEPAIGFDKMLDLTTAAIVNGAGYDGVDLFLFQPHMDVFSDADVERVAEAVQKRNLKIGSFVAPVWPGTVGASAMGSDEERKKFLEAIEISCKIGQRFKELGVRDYGCVRIDSATPTSEWAKDPGAGTKRIAETFKEAAKIAKDHGERLAAEGEICWGGMHSWKDMLQLLEMVGEPEAVGFQADLAHTYLYLLGYNAPEHKLLEPDHDEAAFKEAYQTMVGALGPWLFDFHVAQNDGTVFGSGSHDKTGRHCPADANDGKLDIVECSLAWLLDDNGQIRNGIEHICWDGCMFPNETLENPKTWTTILEVMQKVRTAVNG